MGAFNGLTLLEVLGYVAAVLLVAHYRRSL